MRFKVGGKFFSRDKIRGDITVRGPSGERSQVKLKYLGKIEGVGEQPGYGMQHQYEVVAITEMRRIN